jgi:DNA polymerase III alpha subunit (gram-positive type)
VSHNAPFDVGFLNAMRAKAGMPPITNPVIDTLALVTLSLPGSRPSHLGRFKPQLEFGCL